MEHSDRNKFAQVLIALAHYYGKELPDGVLEIYFNALKSRVSIEQLRDAANKIVLTEKFFPKVPDFLQFVTGNLEDLATEAWLRFVDAVGSAGSYRSVDCGSETPMGYAIQATFGSWIAACQQLPAPENVNESPMLASYRKRFIEHYRMALQIEKQDAPTYFAGLTEMQNRLGGFDVLPNVAYIGAPRIMHALEDGLEDGYTPDIREHLSLCPQVVA